LKLALRSRLDRSHRRPLPGPRINPYRADRDAARFGATAGPAALIGWAALFDRDADAPSGVAHRWRRT